MRAFATPDPIVGWSSSKRPRRWRAAARAWLATRAADFWLNALFWHARRRTSLSARTKAFILGGAWRCSRTLRNNTMLNARRLLGDSSTILEREALGRRVVENFFDFVCDVGRSAQMSRQQLLDCIERIDGDDRYRAVRALRQGAIIVTAHMGSFEVGMAALLEREKRVHVLFRRDALGLFEQTRSALRKRLGVNEVPVDEGLSVWLRLRDALARDEAVLIQGDRTMPGQKGRQVPFLGGHVMLPTGPVKLAMASGAPILPVFTIRLPDGRVRLFVEEPIVVRPEDSSEAALEQLASVIERYVRAYPDQWLMIHPAWCEDNNSGLVTRAFRPCEPIGTGETPVSPVSNTRSPSPFNSLAR